MMKRNSDFVAFVAVSSFYDVLVSLGPLTISVDKRDYSKSLTES